MKRNYVELLNKPLILNSVTMGRLAASENELIRADEMISRHPLLPAIRHQMLRVEALASVAVEGSKIAYDDLAKLEFFSHNSPHSEGDIRAMLKRASRLEMLDPRGAVSAVCQMRALEWICHNVGRNTVLGFDVLDEIVTRYDENAIERAWAHQNGQSRDDRLKEPAILAKQRREHMSSYLEFFNSDLFMPSTQAEISHAIIQSIGVGQCRQDGYERLFSHMIFYRRGLLSKAVAPLAVGPAIDVERHATSIHGNMGALSKHDDVSYSQFDFNSVAFCTSAPARTMIVATRGIESLHRKWTKRLKAEGKHDTLNALMELMLEWNILTIDFASKELGKSFSTISAAIKKLEAAGIVKECGLADKSRLYCAPDALSFFESLLRKVISANATTRDEALAKIERLDAMEI
ncbi:MAG: hypothetical protein PUD02_06925 [Eggerthellales bacterium]|nr:hypothetical protein [Eggerthellales bacterium]